MLKIGAHISASKGFLSMGQRALDLGANTFAFFTRNPRGGRAKAVDGADVMAFRDLAAANGFAPVVAHAAYTMNPCARNETLRAFTRDAMADDLARLSHLPGSLYNFHPGCHVGQGAEAGAARIAQTLNAVLSPGQRVTILLETMSGKGSEMGGTFEELRAILDQVALSGKVGVCLDTCHVWDAGYDIVSDLDGVLAAFDRAVGLEKLLAVHLNDSLNPRGSRKDRHARLGHGAIGRAALARVLLHPFLRDLPFILETPNDNAGWAEEIAWAKAVRASE